MALEVGYPVHRQEGLSLGSQHPHNKQLWWSTLVIPKLGGHRQDPGGCAGQLVQLQQ